MSIRILVCLDGSTWSEAAGRVALQIAKAVPGAVLTALHVVNVRTASGNLFRDLGGRLGFEPAVVSEQEWRAAEDRGRELLEGYARDGTTAGLAVQPELANGAVAERIAHFARHCDLLVMGLRGQTEDAQPGQGGASMETVLYDVAIPILFVTRGAAAIDSIALGYDGSAGAARAVAAVRLIGEPLRLAVHAIYVDSDGKGGSVLDEAESQLSGVRFVRHVVQDDEPHAAIVRVAEQVQASAVAVGFRGHSALKHFLYGSSADYILMNTSMMVLVAR